MKMKRIPLPLALASLGLGALSLAPSAALADSPLPAPTGLQAQHVSDGSADLTWSSSGLSAGDVVQDLVHGSWQQYPTANPVFGYLHLTSLTRGTTYTFRVYSVPVGGLGYTTSPRPRRCRSPPCPPLTACRPRSRRRRWPAAPPSR